ncbi:MAG: hypothetical protein JWN93_3444 [Hyphomicrobiales bacterium]|nr:hypothetical protein [Hyphomicrobiales bacterium]
MTKFSLAAACLLIAAPALGADLPSRSAPQAPGPAYSLPLFSWSGYYAGAQAFYAQGRDKWSAPAQSLKPDGFGAGLHAGYNWTFGQVVAGLEGDVEYGKASAHRFALGALSQTQIGFRSSARLRAGYAFDSVLLYVTGGAAAARVQRSVATAQAVSTGESTRLGWTAGAGVEYALAENWSARAEYRFSAFGSQSAAWSGAGAHYALKDHSLRVGASYRVGEAAGPVVARY